MKNKKPIALIALIISVFIHGLIFSVPAYLYYMKYIKTDNNTSQTLEPIFTIEASILPDIKKIGDKSIIKGVSEKSKEVKKEEIGKDINNSEITTDGDEADSEMLVLYDFIKRKIQENKKYPYEAKQKNIEGIVEMQFAIDKCGLLKDISVIKSSGYQILDDEALSTVKRASPYPVIPERLKTDNLKLQVRLIYKIE